MKDRLCQYGNCQNYETHGGDAIGAPLTRAAVVLLNRTTPRSTCW
jgi:hypothetical protein